MSRFEYILVQSLDGGAVVIMDESVQAEVVIPRALLGKVVADLQAKERLSDSSPCRMQLPWGHPCIWSAGHSGACMCALRRVEHR